MKKMGLLIALATVLTVGGVYATWQYADKDDVASQTKEVTVGITEATSDVTAGSIQVGGTMSFKVDQADELYHGKLVQDAEQTVTFTFVPAAGASLDYTNGVRFTWTLSIDGTEGEYDSKEILVYKEGAKTKTETDADNLTWSITGTEVLAAIGVNQNITVPNSAAHTEFGAALANAKITITVSVDKD